MKNSIICWWSGGITSAVACQKAIEFYGLDSCRIVFIDTKNEDDDTYRFKDDCAVWYGKPIETITAIGDKYKSIEDVWRKYNSLNVAHGAVCSGQLKRRVRELWQKDIDFKYQVFGFEFSKWEFNRAIGLKLNHHLCNPIFPLLMLGLDKDDCIKIVEDRGIAIPQAYKLGFSNNNCLKTGCIQGGIGYWKKMKAEHPDKFDKMAAMEHELTNNKGKPVTMIRDQSEDASKTKVNYVFLKAHPEYPDLKTIDQMRGNPIKSYMECNGFCGTSDFNGPSMVETELNFEFD